MPRHLPVVPARGPCPWSLPVVPARHTTCHQLVCLSSLTAQAPGGTVGGTVAAGWEPVREAFARNFAEGLEKTAQLVIRIAGVNVVDLWGASPSAVTTKGPMDGDTITNIFSSGKQIETAVMALLVQRGLVKYDDAVSKHWPAFGQGGKDEITVADVMRHEGGCPWFLNPDTCGPGDSGTKPEDFVIVTPASLTDDPSGLDVAIENSPRVQSGETTRTYHAMSRGCLVDGILRRVDPAGRGIDQFVREEICEPLGVTEYLPSIGREQQGDFNLSPIGFPESLFSEYMEIGPAMQGFGDPMVVAMLEVMSLDEATGQNSAGGGASQHSGNGFGYSADQPDLMMNQETGKNDGALSETPEMMECTLTSALTHASARAQATIYGALYCGEAELLTPETVELALDKEDIKHDSFMGMETTFTQGGLAKFGDNGPPDSVMRVVYDGFYGWAGWGGSISVVDPARKVSCMYVMSAMANGLVGDKRMIRVMGAVQDCLKAA